ncbi:helix-turn-helix domain-containing protein [Actinomadura sp. NPDC047616]|uniref:helix-turn-helix domain-containing protein n=1 Tax=Actinomadura sp. NPDC047616 TaxID=3155914 RepID=UPI00340E73ED
MHEIPLDRKSQAALLLARGMSTDAVGAELGVNGSTVRRWRQDPAFQQEVHRISGQLLGEAVNALKVACRDAITTLHAALEDDSATIRVRAAGTLLGALPSIAAHFDLEARLTALEDATSERTAS